MVNRDAFARIPSEHISGPRRPMQAIACNRSC